MQVATACRTLTKSSTVLGSTWSSLQSAKRKATAVTKSWLSLEVRNVECSQGPYCLVSTSVTQELKLPRRLSVLGAVNVHTDRVNEHQALFLTLLQLGFRNS
jgi:hypothetical protein